MDRFAGLMEQSRGGAVVGMALSFLGGGLTLYALSTDLAIKVLNALLHYSWIILLLILAVLGDA